jgi:hypothetical protein
VHRNVLGGRSSALHSPFAGARHPHWWASSPHGETFAIKQEMSEVREQVGRDCDTPYWLRSLGGQIGKVSTATVYGVRRIAATDTGNHTFGRTLSCASLPRSRAGAWTRRVGEP